MSKIGNTGISSLSSLTDECAAEKLKNFRSSSLWTCLHHMVILKSQNKITDFFMILSLTSPFNCVLQQLYINSSELTFNCSIQLLFNKSFCIPTGSALNEKLC